MKSVQWTQNSSSFCVSVSVRTMDDDDDKLSTIIYQLQSEQKRLLLGNNINNNDTKRKTSEEYIKTYSAIDLRVYRSLLYMRRTRVLQKVLKDNYNAITSAIVNDDSVHKSINYIRRIHLAFMKIYSASKKDGEFYSNPKCATYDSVVLATIKLWLTDEHACQSETFFHKQCHIMDDIMMSMASLNKIYKEVYNKYIIYSDLFAEAQGVNNRSQKNNNNITELVASLRKLYLSIGYYLGKQQEICFKCQEMDTGCIMCSQTSQKPFRLRDDIVIAGKSADLMRYMKCLKDDIIKIPCSCK